MAGARPVQVARVRERDAGLLRELRLPALAESPEAFERTLEEESRMSDAAWSDRAARNARGEESVGFFGFVGGEPCGLVAGILVGGDEVLVCSLWVDPARRRAGLGRSLIEAVEQWAIERSASSLALWVVESNDSAAALYRMLGFDPTEEVRPVSSRPTQMERLLRKPLSDL